MSVGAMSSIQSEAEWDNLKKIYSKEGQTVGTVGIGNIMEYLILKIKKILPSVLKPRICIMKLNNSEILL